MSDEKTLIGNWNYPTRMRFGAGRLNELGKVCASLGIKRPLIATDQGLKSHPMISRAMDICKAADLVPALFTEIKPNPTGMNVAAGVGAYRSANCDGVVAIGGGSALDGAKAVALMVGQDRPLWDFEDVGRNWQRVNPDGMAKMIAIPTTAGTGSETGRASVIVDEDAGVKRIIFHPDMMPATVIADPELTVGLPAPITAATGIDAFTHCLEAYCSPFYHPMAAGIAVEGMRLVKEWLPKAYEDGTNLEARAHMMAAASMGSTAFQKGLGGIHALSHPVGAVYDTHHGLTNAVFLPYVLAFNRPAIEERIERAGRYMGIKGAGFGGFMDWVLEMRQSMGIPHQATALGLSEEDLDDLARKAAEDPSAGGNPVPLGTAEMKALYQAAMSGTL